MYDHPFQEGSKRTGPDLARVGGRYSDEWHVQHLKDPQSVVPDSIMPQYGFLAENRLALSDPDAMLTALRRVGVPYTDRDIEMAKADLAAQANPDADAGDLEQRYPKAQVRDFDGDPTRVTELRSEEHTSELQSLMRISYAVSCLNTKNINTRKYNNTNPQHKCRT